MPCFVHFFLVSAVQKLLKSVKIWQSCSQMKAYTAKFYKLRQKYRFWFFQVRCPHTSGDVINFIIVGCRVSSRLKRYKKYKNRLRLAKVIVKNKMSHFLWVTVQLVYSATRFSYADTIPDLAWSKSGLIFPDGGHDCLPNQKINSEDRGVKMCCFWRGSIF